MQGFRIQGHRLAMVLSKTFSLMGLRLFLGNSLFLQRNMPWAAFLDLWVRCQRAYDCSVSLTYPSTHLRTATCTHAHACTLTPTLDFDNPACLRKFRFREAWQVTLDPYKKDSGISGVSDSSAGLTLFLLYIVFSVCLGLLVQECIIIIIIIIIIIVTTM